MIGTTQNFSARIAVKGFLRATVLTLVLIETLVLVSSARATVATVQPEGGSTTLEVGSPSGGSTAPSEGAGTPEGTAAEGEGTPAEQTPPAEDPAPLETSTPAESTTVETTAVVPEATPPASTEGLPEVIQTTQETVSQAGEVLAPVIKEVAVPEVVVTSTPTEERVKPTESTKESAQAEATAAPTAAVSPPPPSAPQATVLTTPPAVSGAEPQERPTRAGPGAITVTPLSAAQRAGEISCALSGLTGRMSEDCSAGLLSGSSLITVDPVVPASEASPARRSAPVGGGYSEPAGGGRSGMPPPSPPPGGAFGGSAAAGSGIALSGFFTLAGLLLFAAPCAMRRLRLSCRPWRTAFFVLIPERPG